MQIASVMADDVKPEPGAPIPKDTVDPELIKLARKSFAPRIGLITAAGILFLAVLFLVKLNPDRRFSGNDDKPTAVSVADVAAGKVDVDRYIAIETELMMSQAVRTGTETTSVGMRVVPARGTAGKVWLVLNGDGWAEPSKGSYVGRLRPLSDLPFAGVMHEFVAKNPRPVFAQATAVRAGFGGSKVTTVAGDTIELRDGDKVGFDVIDPNAAVLVCTYNERLPNLVAWVKALSDAGVTTINAPRESNEQVRFDVAMPSAVATLGTKLEAASLWAARVEPVTHHYETTWGTLKSSGPAGFTVSGATIPDTQLDLVGLYTAREVPDGAYALILGERPQDYWYVLPVTILVALIGLVFLWALVKAVKRDLLAPRTTAAS